MHHIVDVTRFETLNEGIIQQLVAKLGHSNRLISDAAYHGLVSQHMMMAHRISASYKRKLTIKIGASVDDIYGAGYLGLVQGCVWVRDGRLKHSEVTAYLAVTVRRFCQDYCECDHSVPIERRALKDYYQKGILNQPSLTEDPSLLRAVECHPYAQMLEGEIVSLFSGLDSKVILGLIRCETQREMAEKLTVPLHTIHKTVCGIREKILSKELLDVIDE